MNSAAAYQLAQADQALQLLLADLDLRAAGHVALADVQALTAAVQQYQQAVTACLPPAPVDVLRLTPAELLAYREADPIYRLGWVRGHQAGTAQAQRRTAAVFSAYAQHAALPSPADPTALMQQVRRFLAQLQQRYSARSIPPFPAARPV